MNICPGASVGCCPITPAGQHDDHHMSAILVMVTSITNSPCSPCQGHCHQHSTAQQSTFKVGSGTVTCLLIMPTGWL